MSPLCILQDYESDFSNWNRSSYSESLRHLTYLVERRWTSSRSLISFFSHGRQAWNEYPKLAWMDAPYNLWESAGVISMNDALIALIIEFTFLAAFAHLRLSLSVLSTITPKERWWLTHLRRFPFSWYWGLLFFACWGCSLRPTHLSVLNLMRVLWDTIDS